MEEDTETHPPTAVLFQFNYEFMSLKESIWRHHFQLTKKPFYWLASSLRTEACLRPSNV